MKRFLFIIFSVLSLSGCSATPTPVAPVVTEFDAGKYLGKWYEIVRLPHSFEDGLEAVTAEYRQNADGTIEVTNRGYEVAKGKWNTAIGYAKPVDTAMYRVTFFWPFYGGYYVSWLDADSAGNYQVSIVTSDSHDYFWVLARTPNISEEVIATALSKAEQWGFDTNRMIRVNHSIGHQ